MSVPEAILFATGNPHKVEEVAAILAEVGLHVDGLSDLDHTCEEPEEHGRTFLANAILKAKGYAAQTGQLVLADDSGLEVDALGGAPGVYSARYAGMDGPRNVVDPANNQKLLAALAQVPDPKRTARFVCVLALCDDQKVWAVSRGAIEGQIGHSPIGEHGFGYDPLFFVPELNQTTAQLSPDKKNSISHRGQAARQMAQLLRIIRTDD